LDIHWVGLEDVTDDSEVVVAAAAVLAAAAAVDVVVAFWPKQLLLQKQTLLPLPHSTAAKSRHCSNSA